MEHELIVPSKQKHWGWPAVFNFVLGGAGSGFYLLSTLSAVQQRGWSVLFDPVSYGWLAGVIAFLGFITLAVEAGRPLRGCYALSHARHSWISRETLFFILFLTSVLVERLFVHPIVHGTTVVSALGFMISQGFIVYRSRAVKAWNVSIMPIFFLSSGFASGFGIVLLVTVFARVPLEPIVVSIGLTFIVLNSVIWFIYLYWPGGPEFYHATKKLRHPVTMTISLGLGHMIPLILLSLLLINLDKGISVETSNKIVVISGLAILCGVASQKAEVIMLAGYTNKVVLKSHNAL